MYRAIIGLGPWHERQMHDDAVHSSEGIAANAKHRFHFRIKKSFSECTCADWFKETIFWFITNCYPLNSMMILAA